MTKTKKILALIIVALMAVAVLPVASMAENVGNKIDEIQTEAYWQKVWAPLNEVEAEAIAMGASPAEVTMAVYKAALANPDIDEGSIADLDDNGFSFTTKGMHGGYDYKLRNIPYVSAVNDELLETIVEVANVRAEAASKTASSNGPTSANVLLVGPWYSSDSSFTDQYKNEAQELASDLGGTYTVLQNSNAYGTAIATGHLDKGIVIYDSHGASYSSTSYIQLTSSTSLTSTDYSNGWAYNGSSWYGIDGRYIQNHCGGTLSNCMVWMAMCEGMKLSGGGKTGTALLAAGAGVVYGYSQSVSFTGDYKYEAYFWDKMRDGYTVAEAFAAMTSYYGNWDPAYSSSSGAAWPIVMSPVDSYPSNPDSHQTVYSDWVMFPTSADPDPITSVSVANVNVVTGGTANVNLTVNPSNADYTVQSYTSSNTSVATVTSAGVVTGVAAGTATLTVRVKDNTNNAVFTATATITVEDFEGYMLVDSIEDGGTYIIVDSAAISGTSGYAVGNTAVTSGHYLTPVAVTINSDDTCTVSSANEANVLWVASGNATSGYSFYNQAAGVYMSLDSSEYLYPGSTAVAWLYDSNQYLNNQIDSEGYYYLSYSTSTTTRYTTSKNGSAIKLYKLITSSEPEPTYYTVTFKDWDGTVLSTQQVIEGGAATAPANPSRTGYTFAGWDKTFNNITADTVVTATYTINSYYVTVYYQYEDGTTAATTYRQSYNYGAAYSVTSPVIEGYTASQAVVSGTMGTSAVTVTVTYTADPVEPDTLIGDVNCDGVVNFADISALYGYIMGSYTPTAQGIINADVNQDGSVNFTDVSALYALILAA